MEVRCIGAHSPSCPAVDPVLSVRAPLRISLGGGGTDLPSYYRSHGGFVLSAAIDRYVRVRVSPASGPRFRLEHLFLEEVEDPAEVEHPILRAALARHWNGRPLDLVSISDVPPGTGLGSSGAYTVCAIKALDVASGRDPSPVELAEAACDVELGDLGRTVGKQDQYAAAHGGANAFTFGQDGQVGVRRLTLGAATREAFAQRFLLFGTGGQQRSAADMLATQVARTLAGDDELRRNLGRAEELGRAACAALEADRPDELGRADERPVGAQARAACRRADGPRRAPALDSAGRRRRRRDAGGRRRRGLPAGLRRRRRGACGRR